MSKLCQELPEADKKRISMQKKTIKSDALEDKKKTRHYSSFSFKEGEKSSAVNIIVNQ